MKIALVVLGTPKTKDAFLSETMWQDFELYTQKILPQSKNIQRIGKNVWQIPLDNELPFLGKLVHLAEQQKISAHIAYLDDAPTWTIYPQPNQKTS